MNILFPSISKLRAFSLVEILVVLGLFSGITTLALGALFNAQTINGHLQETQSILDNVNLSLQTITREIRYGTEFYCSTVTPTSTVPLPSVRKNCAYGADGSGGGGIALFFKPADVENDRDRIAYYVKNGTLYEDEYTYGEATTTFQLTTNDVLVKSLTFYVDGAQTSDGSNDDAGATDKEQPLITLLISGQTKSAKTNVPSTPFDIQTTISSRDIDNK